MKDYIAKYKCLGDETRVRILKTLIVSSASLCVCELVDILDLPAYTISKHLKELKNADLVTEEKEGKFTMYGLSQDKGNFNKYILESIKSIPEEVFAEDVANMNKRLSVRVDGKCVVGMNGGKNE